LQARIEYETGVPAEPRNETVAPQAAIATY